MTVYQKKVGTCHSYNVDLIYFTLDCLNISNGMKEDERKKERKRKIERERKREINKSSERDR